MSLCIANAPILRKGTGFDLKKAKLFTKFKNQPPTPSDAFARQAEGSEIACKHEGPNLELSFWHRPYGKVLCVHSISSGRSAEVWVRSPGSGSVVRNGNGPNEKSDKKS